MGTESPESLATFKRLLEEACSDPEASAVTLAEALVGRERAVELLRCAIPHQFDGVLLQVVAPWLSPEEAGLRLEEFGELSIVHGCSGHLAIHERWRKTLLGWWLRPENRGEFEEVSRSLAGYFGRLAEVSSGSEAEAALRSQMYHLLGAARDAGLGRFASLCRRARHQWRFAECAALIRLVHDYDPVLTPTQRATVTYHEGKLAADTRDWRQAEAVFRGVVVDEAASTPTRVNAWVRLGHSLREQGRLDEAIESLQTARSLAASDAAPGLVWRALHELGEAYRDAGMLDLAESVLRKAIDSVGEQGGVDRAGLFNSLGTVHLKRRDPGEAVSAFQESLRELDRVHDVFRPAQVHNNLALAYSELRDWARAEASFVTSLELKRQAGDLAGRGLGLENLSRAQAAQGKLEGAIESASEAVVIFESLQDARGAGIAKYLLGRHHLRRQDRERARPLFEEALRLLSSGGDEQTAASVRAELQALQGRRGLPWWAWVLVGVGVLFACAFVIVVIVGLAS
jgi:tetratricopeptide (TPR) repeat protein